MHENGRKCTQNGVFATDFVKLGVDIIKVVRRSKMSKVPCVN